MTDLMDLSSEAVSDALQAAPIDTGPTTTNAAESARSTDPVGRGATDLAAGPPALPPGFHTRSQLRSFRPPSYLVSQLVPRGGLSGIAGRPGSGKTFVALDLACCIATGTDFHGQKVRRGRVLYIAAESSGAVGPRISAWEHKHGAAVPDAYLAVVARPVCLNDQDSLERFTNDIREWLKHYGPVDLIVVDTVAQTMNGAENDSAPMKQYLDALAMLRDDFECSILLIHHTPKDTAEKSGQQLFRGHGSLFAALDSGLYVQPDGRWTTLSQVKSKEDEPAPNRTFERKQIDLSGEYGHHEDGRPITSCVLEPVSDPSGVLSRRASGPPPSPERLLATEAILDRLKTGPARHGELKAAVQSLVSDPKKAKSAFKNAFGHLRNDGLIEQQSDDRWRLLEVAETNPEPIPQPTLTEAQTAMG